MEDDGTKQVEAFACATATPRRATPTVIVYDGDEIGALHALSKRETSFGRTAECDVVLAETRVSRRHAVIRCVNADEGTFELADLGSTNGTFVNGEPISRAILRSGDKIAIGSSTLKFALLDEQDLSYQARIVEMIHVDDLTGLLTKRSLFRALEKELIRAERYHHPLAVLMMDLDHFKQVNDTHGHLVGSHCIAEVGRVIRECTRAVDVNGRYGGEEFVSYLPETGTDEALTVAERIRTGLAGHRFRRNETSYEARISIGIAVFPDHGATVEELVHAADVALYRAKESGRDRCIVYEVETLATR